MSKDAKDLEPLNKGESYDPITQEISRLETFEDIVRKVQQNSEKSIKRFKKNNFIGQIYTSRIYTISEIQDELGDDADTLLSELGKDKYYRGYNVYIPVRNSVYPNVSAADVIEYNRITSGNLKDKKTKKLISLEDYLDSLPENKKKQQKLVIKRIRRFPVFFQKGNESEGAFPDFCKVEEYDTGTPLNYGIFKETISRES